jgi:predicted nucleotidyltransferase
LVPVTERRVLGKIPATPIAVPTIADPTIVVLLMMVVPRPSPTVDPRLAGLTPLRTKKLGERAQVVDDRLEPLHRWHKAVNEAALDP